MKRLFLCLAIAASACAQSGPDGTTRTGGDAPYEDGFEDTNTTGTSSVSSSPAKSCGAPLDVVFVIDVSQSMDLTIDRVAQGMSSIWNAAHALSDDTQFGLVVFVDDVRVVNNCAPFPSVEAMQSEFAQWSTFSREGGQPGGSSAFSADCVENTLDALHAAASTCAFRDNATKLIIHVTNDTFEEPPYMFSVEPEYGQAGLAAQHSYDETINLLVQRQIRVGAFARRTTPDCWGEGRPDRDTAPGFHAPFRGKQAIPEATQGRVWDLAEVEAGRLDMATAINEMITTSYCEELI